jgi:hypothetical protein
MTLPAPLETSESDATPATSPDPETFRSKKELAALLRTLKEGDVIEFGQIFKFSDEDTVWCCLENHREDGIAAQEPYNRLTFHAYYMEVFIGPQIVVVYDDDTLEWN